MTSLPRLGAGTDDGTTVQGRTTGWLAVLAVLVVVQLVALYAPSTPGGPEVDNLDKVVHASIFAAPTVAALAAGWHARWLIGILTVHAPVSELIQAGFLPHRGGDPRDVVADLTGITLAIVAFVVCRRLRR